MSEKSSSLFLFNKINIYNTHLENLKMKNYNLFYIEYEFLNDFNSFSSTYETLNI